ncbi:MAG: single-stranded DNA-binding protein [Acidimicrobiales bacterium]|jgi:single-strand DNA-binding protein
MTANDGTPTAKVGNVTRDPELRFGKSGIAFTTFGLAHKPYVGRDEPEPEVVFYEVVCFHTLAEHVAESILKGDRVVVVGRGELEHWTGKDGVERLTKKILADGCGPDLRFTAAEIQRAQRQEPAAVTSSGGGYDEEPF